MVAGHRDQRLAAKPGLDGLPPGGRKATMIRCPHAADSTPDFVAKRWKNGRAGRAVHAQARSAVEHLRRGIAVQRPARTGVGFVPDRFDQRLRGRQFHGAELRQRIGEDALDIAKVFFNPAIVAGIASRAIQWEDGGLRQDLFDFRRVQNRAIVPLEEQRGAVAVDEGGQVGRHGRAAKLNQGA